MKPKPSDLSRSTRRKEWGNLAAVLLADIALRLGLRVEEKQEVLSSGKEQK